jgi:hypothetical protein
MSDKESDTITGARADLFEATQPLLEKMGEEFRKFASKKPDATVSKAKVAFVNRILKDLKGILANEPTIKYLDLLTDEDLPQYSDVVLILSQYEAAMEAFKSRYYHYSTRTASHEWKLKTTKR